MTDEVMEKIERVLGSLSVYKIFDVFVTEESENKYRLFNKFIVEKVSKNEIITKKIDSEIEHVFSTVKNSITWCIFYNQGQLYKANRIAELDKQVTGLEVEELNLKRLFKKTQLVENKLVFLNKLTENKLKRATYTKQIATLTQEATDYQTKKFNQKSKLQEKR